MLTRDTNVIVDNIISFLASEGFDLRDDCRAELAARVEGFIDLSAQKTDARERSRSLVYELGLDDICGPGGLLEGFKDTLSRAALAEFDGTQSARAHAYAQSRAAELGRPTIVLNGLGHVLGVCDEPAGHDSSYTIYRPMGLLKPDALFANLEFSEDLDLFDGGILTLRDAVGLAHEAAYRDATGDTPNPLVVVDDSMRILWRSKSLRG
jgi:hypothetical protein